MEDIQDMDIKKMLSMVLEQQSQLMVKVEGIQQQQSQLVVSVQEVQRQLRCMDWERLRWRHVEWERIPPDSRVRVIPFLAVEDILSLNSAISNKNLRKDLKKSYKNAVIPALDRYRFTDWKNFKGLRWAMKMGVDLQQCELVLMEQAGGVVEGADSVLRWLVDNGREDLAAVHGTKSGARDMMKVSEGWGWVSTLLVAASKGYVEVVRAMVEGGADMDKAKENGCTPLYVASEMGHVEVVRMLLEQGADINKAKENGCTPLYVASEKGHVEVVRMLLEQGADINKACDDGYTPLYVASGKGHEEVVRVLLEQGADINKAKENACTPLYVASEKGRVEVVRMLMEGGADMDKAKENGCTPLYVASAMGHADVVRTLVEQGADIRKACKSKTPLDIARQKQHSVIIHLLELAAQV